MARVGTVCSYFSQGKLELRDYVNIYRRGKKGKEKKNARLYEQNKDRILKESKRKKGTAKAKETSGRSRGSARGYVKHGKTPCDHEVNTRNTCIPFPQTKSLLLL